MAPQVVIFCDLQKPIRVAAEVMGKSLDAVIDGKAVKIHMPEVTWETIFELRNCDRQHSLWSCPRTKLPIKRVTEP